MQLGLFSTFRTFRFGFQEHVGETIKNAPPYYGGCCAFMRADAQRAGFLTREWGKKFYFRLLRDARSCA